MRYIVPVVLGTMMAVTMMGPAAQRLDAQQSAPKARLDVDWNDPAITAPQSLRGNATAAFKGQQARVDVLKLPVIGFTEPPEIARRVMGASASETSAPEIVFDTANPIWFHLEQTFGDVTVTVDADLRVDKSAADTFSTKSLGGGRVGAATPQQDSRISILEEGAQQGEGGVMANYTIYRFPNIPYAVTITCVGPVQKACRDLAVIKRDQAMLKVIAGQR